MLGTCSRLRARLHIIETVAKSALCALAIAMLLLFPLRTGHQFANHFRTDRVVRQIKRNTSIAQPERKCAHVIALPSIDPIRPIENPAALKIARRAQGYRVPKSTRPVTRTLIRVQLGRSQSDIPPPLS